MSENVYQSVWPGLNSYTEDDQARFFGRDREIDQLQDVISTEPLCTIYGSSGVGKTSLLLAGVFPRLRVRGCLPVYLRLGHDEGAKPYAVQIVDGCLRAAQKARLEVKETCPARGGAARETLWEWFHRHEFVNAVKKPVRPVLVIDQFEEVFTLGSGKAASEGWFDELTDLCSNSVPEAVADAMADSEDGLGFSTEDQSWHVVICLREDFLSHLEERTVEYPVFRQNRIAVSALSKEKALEAVLNGGRDVLDEPVARMIVDYVGGSTGKIEAPLLSLFCSRLDLLRQKNGQEKISLELVERNRDDILGNFYNESMGRVSESARDYLETALLNANGYRNQVQIDDVEQHGVKPDEWRALERERLLHVVTRDNVQWLEFSHDTL
ncbi:MAG: ATP-binding protein, partial [Clostridia bacterium]|nr:ATP-binding protein [Clostridia bacterium]